MDSPKKTVTNLFKSRQEIAKELGISVSTLYRRLKEKNMCFSKRLLSPKEQAVIYDAFGLEQMVNSKTIVDK